MTAEEASKITPHLDWAAFFDALDVPASDGFSLSQPKIFAEFDAMLADVPAEQWRDYLAFHTIDDASAYLSAPFPDANSPLLGKHTNGTPAQEARWKRVRGRVTAENRNREREG